MPYRPQITQPSGAWLGFQDAQIVDFEDKSEQYDWADVFIQVTFKIPTSQYPVNYHLKGSYERNNDGTIKETSLLKRIYYLFDAIGCTGGPDKEGKWVDEDDKPIENISNYLNKYLTPNALNGNDTPYYIYVYKERGKDGKNYTRVATKIVKNESRQRKDLESWIAFMKGKGYLKEVTETSNTSATHVTPNNVGF